MALLRKDARETVIVKSGTLKKAIKTKVSLKRNGEMTGKVFVKTKGKGAAPYAHLVEWGGQNNSSTRFMTRVFEANKDKVIAEFRNQLIANIKQVGTL